MTRQSTGIIRSLTIEITKYSNGTIVSGYPKEYDGKSGFTWNEVEYELISENQLAELDDLLYTQRLAAWQSYVESIESGLDLDTDLDPSYPAYKEDPEACPIDFVLTILNVDLDCTGTTLYISFTGGTGPYSISLDNGQTYPVTGLIATSYTFTGFTGTTVEVMVVDSLGGYYRWQQLTCDDITVTFIPIFLTPDSDGYIEDESSIQHGEQFSITLPYGSIYSVSGIPITETSFNGWTTYRVQSRGSVDRVHFTETGVTYQHIFLVDTEIYAIFTKDDAISLDFCYFPSNITGYTPTQYDYNYYCENCINETTVYMARTLYNDFGVLGATWYSDSNLTTEVPNGYYKLIVTGDTEQTLYKLYGGVAIIDNVCNGSILLCDTPSPTPTPTPPVPSCSNPRYRPDNRVTYFSRNFWGKGPTLNITNMALSNIDTAIVDYCADRKTYHSGSNGIQFYLDSTEIMAVGDPVYKFNLPTNCTLYDKNVSVILSGDSIPCSLSGEIAIRIEYGYIVEMITITA